MESERRVRGEPRSHQGRYRAASARAAHRRETSGIGVCRARGRETNARATACTSAEACHRRILGAPLLHSRREREEAPGTTRPLPPLDSRWRHRQGDREGHRRGLRQGDGAEARQAEEAEVTAGTTASPGGSRQEAPRARPGNAPRSLGARWLPLLFHCGRRASGRHTAPQDVDQAADEHLPRHG